MNGMGSRGSKNGKSKNEKGSTSDFSVAALARGVLAGIIVWVLSAVILSAIGAAAAYKTSDPAALAKPVGIAVLYISSLLGGFFAAKKCGGNRLLCGVFLAATVLIILLASKFAVGDAENLSPSVLLHSGVPLFAVIGALLSGYGKRSGKKRKKTPKFGKK